MAVELTLTPVEQKPLLKQLMQLYLYDFADYTQDDLPENGFYSYPYLDLYWEEPGRYPFLIRADGQVAGFVLVRITRDADGQEINQIAEFFVLRKYRRRKVGQTAAWMAFDHFPGRWHVQEIPENQPAQRFWRKIINEYTQGQFTEIADPEDGSPIQIFST